MCCFDEVVNLDLPVAVFVADVRHLGSRVNSPARKVELAMGTNHEGPDRRSVFAGCFLELLQFCSLRVKGTLTGALASLSGRA